MLFNSPEFLFAFLPAFLILYFLSPGRLKNAILFLASLLFYFTTSAELTLVLIASVIFNYWAALRIGKAAGPRRQFLFALAVGVNLAPLLYYKYARFFLDATGDALRFIGIEPTLPDINPILPIGISFFTFQAISYVADIFMRRTKAAGNAIDFGMYHSCFPQLIAGPIVRYEEIEAEVRERHHELSDIQNGIVQFCFGLGKKIILADNMGLVANHVFGLPAASLDLPLAWVGIVAYTLQIYFDFSGYSDMAIGLGRVLGFPYPENFNQPYRSLSITEFWRRWHMTLSRWFRDYVYIPLGGNRLTPGRTFFNLVVVFLLCGLWHGAAYTFIVWGLYHGLFLVLERLGATWGPRTLFPASIRWVYTIAVVMVGWVFFRSDTLGHALSFLGSMFDLRKVVISQELAGMMTLDRVTYMIVAVAVALVPFQYLFRFANGRYEFGAVASILSIGVAVLACIMMSVNGFSPFIYFRF
jgi:alginate O-acetyltransferase complex protein AlgI